MTDNLPAPRQEPTREIARTDTDSWTNVFADVVELARGIADTEFVPRGLRGSIPATTAAILYGREVGLPPMTSLNNTHVIEGRPSLAAEVMRAMVIAAGHEIEVLESTGSVFRIRAKRRGSERWTPEVVWTIDMARAAGLLGKNNWKNHPRRMLQARGSSELCELYFPDVIAGFKSVEEMTDELDSDGPAEQAEPSTKVARKRTTRKTAAAKPAPAGKPAEQPDIDGPPLPGDPGYDAPSVPSPGEVTAGQSPAGGEAATAPEGAVGEDVEPPAGDDQGQTVRGDGHVVDLMGALQRSVDAAKASRADDVVDAEIVEEGAPEDALPMEEPPADEEPAPQVETEPKPGPSTRAQHRMLFARLSELEVADSERLAYASALIGREVESFNGISKAEAHTLIETLALIDGRAALDALVDAAEERRS